MASEQVKIMNFRVVIAILVMSLWTVMAQGSSELLQFDNLQQEKRFHALIDELRCMVCQNQNLADSNAALASDLRDRTYRMIRDGNTDDEIIDYMVARYGDFVLYRPPVKTSTYVLWFGPAVIFLLAIVSVLFTSKRMRARTVSRLSSAEQRKVRDLLDK